MLKFISCALALGLTTVALAQTSPYRDAERRVQERDRERVLSGGGYDVGRTWPSPESTLRYDPNEQQLEYIGPTLPSRVADGEETVRVPNTPIREVPVNAGPTQAVAATVLGVNHAYGGIGMPEAASVRVRTDSGLVRDLVLGPALNQQQARPRVSPGDFVVIGGQWQQRGAYQFFQASELRPAGERDRIPRGLYDRLLTGRIERIDRLHTRGGSVDWMNALVRMPDGRIVDVVLGEPSAQQGLTLGSGDRLQLTGYLQTIGAQSRFVVGNIQKLDPLPAPNDTVAGFRQSDRAEARSTPQYFLFLPAAGQPAHQVFGTPVR